MLNSLIFDSLLRDPKPREASPSLRLVVVRLLVLLGVLTLLAPGVEAFGLDDVAARAATLAAAPYRKPSAGLPATIQGLDYDQYRDIRFRPERALWRNSKGRFEIMFFHRGSFFEQPVTIREVSAAGEREIAFDPEAFDYGKNTIDRGDLRGLGFAGFRVHFPVNTPAYKDEVLVFLGASYLRALGRGQRFGLSARGLAIDTTESTGEEFPRFVEYWIERPAATAKELTIYALLDSPSAAGAYRFVLRPGVTTVLDVDARLFARRHVATLGLAPLTSMFLFGANQRPAHDDYRPEVHDSEGLSIQTAKEWIWRPLVNPRRVLVTSFAVTDPLGFGLMQRKRAFAAFHDLEARYDLRPSAWVEPKGAWGAGRVELVQIPIANETSDNVVAYWVPARRSRPGEAFVYGYRLLWQKDRETRPPLGWVSETRRGRGYTKLNDGSVELHVDFDGPTLTRMPPAAGVDLALWTDDNAEVVDRYVRRNDATGGWRAAVRFRRLDPARPVELRAHLIQANEVASETWTYILPPE